MPLIVLVTGSREIEQGRPAADEACALLGHAVALRGPQNVGVMHGAAPGWDDVFDRVATNWGGGMKVWRYPADDRSPGYTGPLSRNEYMVDLVTAWVRIYGYDAECWVFANRWASGTGHCARRARRAGIATYDYGVPTR